MPVEMVPELHSHVWKTSQKQGGYMLEGSEHLCLQYSSRFAASSQES